jgi:hypothetical protein
MKTLDPRIRHEHIARYGATDEIDDYLRTLENLRPVPDYESGQDHHMLARSIWPEYKNLKVHPWNRLRVSYALHPALTEIQSWFEERLRVAAHMMKGQTAEARLEAIRKVHALKDERGKSVHAVKNGRRMHELYPHVARENIRKALAKPNHGRAGGKKALELGVGIHARTSQQILEDARRGGGL